jgi:hypothetical protein
MSEERGVYCSCVYSVEDRCHQKGARWNPPAKVEEYRYGGRRVFLFSANCCDQFNEAFDDSCNYICAPSGGMTGKGDRKCLDFKAVAQFVKVVWQDER